MDIINIPSTFIAASSENADSATIVDRVQTRLDVESVIPMQPARIESPLKDRAVEVVQETPCLNGKSDVLSIAESSDLDRIEEINDLGASYYEPVLSELDRLKDQLGGAPNYHGLRPPAIDMDLQGRTLFGQPLAAVEDWLRVRMQQGRGIVKLFWQFVGWIFGIRQDNMETKYEYSAKAIQRFGLLMQNREQFIDILNSGKEYSTFNKITGLAWHPTINGVQVEVMYFDLLDRFLTEGFRNVKKEGDEALIEYFHALNGVCFEDRMRNIEEYMIRQECSEVLYCADYDSKNTAEEVFELEAIKLFEISGNKVPSPIEFRDHLTSRGVFTTKFSTGLDSKQVPSLEQFQKWVIANQSMYIIKPYTSLNEFLFFEFEIFHSSVESASADVFIDQVSRRFDMVEKDEFELLIEGASERPANEVILRWLSVLQDIPQALGEQT